MAFGIANMHNLLYYRDDGVKGDHTYLHISFIDSPNTTETCEYELQHAVYNTAHSATLHTGNGGHQPSTLTLMEVAQ